MGEAKNRSRKRADILSSESRCIYCLNKPNTVEHMPPISTFRDRRRLSGFEFASCVVCNSSTRAADAAAGLLSRFSPTHKFDLVEVTEAKRLLSTVEQLVPGFGKELFIESKPQAVWSKGRGSDLYGSMQRIELSGRKTAKLMLVFGAKMGMALFREYVGRPLNKEGSVFSKHYFNAGLSQGEAKASLDILPMLGELKMGRQQSGLEFRFRYNCDNKELLAALVTFNDNLFFRIFATDAKVYQDALAPVGDHKQVNVGGLAALMAETRPPHLDPNPESP